MIVSPLRSRATTHRGAPVVDIDLYGDEVIDDAPAGSAMPATVTTILRSTP